MDLRGPSDCPWVQWILGEDTEVCSMIGVNGQFVLIDPCRDIVIVKLSSYPVRRLQDISFVRGLFVTWELTGVAGWDRITRTSGLMSCSSGPLRLSCGTCRVKLSFRCGPMRRTELRNAALTRD